ncbi:MAG: hypothetical protein WAK93_16755 [Solirubrobacteraceae bacterium]
MKRFLLLTASLALGAVPASAAAATSHGVVLSVSSRQHRVQVIDHRHAVHQYRYRGSLPSVGLGSRVRFVSHGSTITAVKSARSRAHRVSFLAMVMRSRADGLLLKLGDGQPFDLVTHQVLKPAYARRAPMAFAAASPSAVQPGLVVLVTETLGRGGASVSIKPASSTSPGVAGARHVAGVVIAVGSSSVTLKTADGTVIVKVPASVLAQDGVQPCDKVTVVYHQTGGTLDASKIKTVGDSSTGSCAGGATGAGDGSSDGSDDGSGDDSTTTVDDNGSPDVIGNITTVSGSGLTISVPGQGSMSFVVDDPEITDGFVVGDNVDVTYSQEPSGTLDASDVEYNENDAVGTVLAVSETSLTISDSDTGARETFTADPSSGMFDGINDGDDVDVSYHLSNGQTVVDEVDPADSSDSSDSGS